MPCAVKCSAKSVENWASYTLNFGATYLWDTLYFHTWSAFIHICMVIDKLRYGFHVLNVSSIYNPWWLDLFYYHIWKWHTKDFTTNMEVLLYMDMAYYFHIRKHFHVCRKILCIVVPLSLLLYLLHYYTGIVCCSARTIINTYRLVHMRIWLD